MTQLRQMADRHVKRPNPSFGGKKVNFEGAVGFEISKKQMKVTGGIKKNYWAK